MLSPEEKKEEIDREELKWRDFMGEDPDWYSSCFNSYPEFEELNFDD